MSLFTSKREQRLWLLALVVLAAIYLSLGFAGALAAELRERGQLQGVIGIGLVLAVGGAILLSWGRRRPGWREIAAALAIALVYLLTWFRISIPEERGHMIEYSILAALIHQALCERGMGGRRVLVPALLAIGLTALLGWVDEGIQLLLPDRIYDFDDVIFNALSGLMMVTARIFLAWAGRRRRGGGGSGRCV